METLSRNSFSGNKVHWIHLSKQRFRPYILNRKLMQIYTYQEQKNEQQHIIVQSYHKVLLEICFNLGVGPKKAYNSCTERKTTLVDLINIFYNHSFEIKSWFTQPRSSFSWYLKGIFTQCRMATKVPLGIKIGYGRCDQKHKVLCEKRKSMYFQ